MTSEGEQRNLSIDKLENTLKKLESSISQQHERMARKHYENIKAEFAVFENLHILYLRKMKKDTKDPAEKDIYWKTAEIVDKAEEIAGEFFEGLEMAKKAQEETRNENSDRDKGKILLQKKKDKILSEIEFLALEISARVSLISDGSNINPVSIGNDVTELETRWVDVKKMFNVYEEDNDDTEDIAEFRSTVQKQERDFRLKALQVHSYADSTIAQPVSNESSTASKMENDYMLKYKKMDFPKFGGNIRNYAVFKRDFQEMLQDSGRYEEKHLSQVMRNECLHGEAQKLVRNLNKMEDIWRKLDQKYDDKSEVIAMISREISGLPYVEEKDFKSFIELVDVLEQASLDLEQMGKSGILNNPITVRQIMEKCPDITRRELTRHLSGVEEHEEFDELLKYLIPRRGDAVRLARLNEHKQSRNIPNKPQNQKVRVNAAKVTSDSKNKDKTWKCITEGCSFNRKHFLAECRAFKRLTPDEKGKLILKEKLCILCFNRDHEAKNCPRKAAGWKECDVDGCNRWHNRWLHGAKVPGLTLTVLATASDDDDLQTLLLVQEVFVHKVPGIVFWDHGSTTSLVTFTYAEKCGLTGVDCSLELTGVGEKTTHIDSKLYMVPLESRNGEIKFVKAFGMDRITGDMGVLDVGEAASVFGLTMTDINRPAGAVDLLIGLDSADILPTQYKTAGKLALYESNFGTGFLLAGQHRSIKRRGPNLAHTVYRVEGKQIKLPDFFSAEEFGVDLPRRCKNCTGCRECSFRARQLTWIEDQELVEIEKGLTLDVLGKKWTSAYPFKEDPVSMRNNFNQAFACLESLEKRLKKNGQMNNFQEQFDDAVNRGIFVKLTDSQVENFTGPVNYVTLTEAYKEGEDVTTPIRLCMNSSMKYLGVSLNDLLMKGPSSLNDIYNVLLNFRTFETAFVKDISKFYQSIACSIRDQHLRRVLWRGGDEKVQPEIYVTSTVNFGDRPAGCISLTALRMTAELFKDIDPEAANKLKTDSYMDDVLSGGKNQEDARRISAKMEEIAECGGFKFKSTIVSGDIVDGNPGKKLKILGTAWLPTTDEIQVEVKVNPSDKKKGAKSQPNLEFEALEDELPESITKRIVWRIVLGQFDLLGLASVFLIRLKLIMRELCGDSGKALGWDENISEETKKKFTDILMLLGDLRNIKFPRCIIPSEIDQEEKPVLIVFGDGSTQAFCTLAYGRWKMTDGSYKCRLISGKTRVAPLRKISVPRMELMGAVAAVRLAHSVQEATNIEFGQRFFFTDSSAVLGMIKNNSAAFLEFVGTRTGEIRSKSNPDSEWFWIPTADNLADMGTRDTVMPKDLDVDTEYQNGKPWMQMSQDKWPCKSGFGTAPPEEFRKTVHVSGVQATFKMIDISRFSSYKKLVGTTSVVLEACQKFSRNKKSMSSQSSHDQAENWLICSEQVQLLKDFKENKLSSLLPRLKKVTIFGNEFQMVVTSGRMGEGLAVGYDKDELPILPASSPLAKLIMKHAHEIEHCGSDRTLQRSRSFAWVIRGRKLAKSVKNDCFQCRRRHKKLQEQIIAPLPQSRLPPAPVFDSTAIDLFGPILIKDTVKGRSKKNTWGVLFCCTVTSAIHLEVSEDYSCDSFLLCLKRFVNLRGTPRRIQSDPGSQLAAASKEIAGWDYSRITEWSKTYRIQWYFTPTDSQHYNGVAEAMIKVTKKQLNDVIKSKLLTKGELDTLFSDVMFIVNSRPLMKSANEDPLSGNPITPLHLLGGRSTLNVPVPEFNEKANLTKRLKFLQQTTDDFWKKWFAQVFPNLVPCYKWRTKYRNVQVGDIVLMKNSNVLRNEYKLAKVAEALPGPDGNVRRVKLIYKNLDSEKTKPMEVTKELKKVKFAETERSVQNIVVIVPNDWSESEIEAAVLTDLKVNQVK